MGYWDSALLGMRSPLMTDQAVNQLITPVVAALILAGASVIGTHLIKRSRTREEHPGGPRPGETSAKKAESPRATRFCLHGESLDI
jgi:hypothetical protein